MKTALKLTAPDDLQAEITIAGTIGEFRCILRHIDSYVGPPGELIRQLREAILKAEQAFISDAKPEPVID